ncbi:ATP-dependent Clp protease proteolytic subunit [Falsiroseomonas sp. HC035]|uniref:ATP-dependent Clp protease proteolytic subunit n=1 Tax=Falsiroseomonas sp. HC035 TaxID=3390999 RepID=UPI003D31D62D
MDITTSDAGDLSVVAAVGSIRPGDAEKFSAAVRSKPGRDVILVINSSGGSVVTASDIAALVSRWRIPVVVTQDCISACFLIFAASPDRWAQRNAQIGVHSASVAGAENADTLAMTMVIAREAAAYGVPRSIIGRMVITNPNDVAWLNDADLRSMRVTYLDDHTATASRQPQVAAPPVIAALPAPAPAPPSASFRQGAADRRTWEEFTDQQSGSYRLGAEFWAGQRSLPRPAPCGGPDPLFVAGCQQAQRFLSPLDLRRRSDPEYRRGWNSP